MARVDVTGVQAILVGTFTEDQINAAIDAATLWIDTFLEPACSALTEEALTTIELYLSAHLTTTNVVGPGELKSAKRADISETYTEPGKGHSSRYIGTAAAFDPCGIIRRYWMEGKVASFKVGTGYAGE